MACVALQPARADAQRRPRHLQGAENFLPAPRPSIGLRGGYDFDADAWSLGAQARVPITRKLQFVPSGDAFFGEGATNWQLNADLAYGVGPLGGIYLGAGLAALNWDADGAGGDDRSTSVGANTFIGLQAPGIRLPVRPFVEARWTFVEDASPFRLAVGANFPLGDRARRARRRQER